MFAKRFVPYNYENDTQMQTLLGDANVSKRFCTRTKPIIVPNYKVRNKTIPYFIETFHINFAVEYKSGGKQPWGYKIRFDLQGKKASLVCTVPYLYIISDYAIVDDKGFRRFTYGGGKLSISLVDNIINIDMGLSTPVRSGKLYIMLESMLISLRTQRTHYKFDEISTNIGGNNEEFVMKHSKILESQLQLAILNLVKDTFRHVTTNIIDNVSVGWNLSTIGDISYSFKK